jgi:hypothetical protein
LCGDALSPWRKTRSRPARSSTATDTRGVHSVNAVSAIVRAILIEIFFSDRTWAFADAGTTSAAAAAARANTRNDMGSSR